MATQRPRSKLCRNYALGNCPQGNNCKYIHTDAFVFTPVVRPQVQNSINTVPVSPISPITIASPPTHWAIVPGPFAPSQLYSANWSTQFRPPDLLPSATRPIQFRALSWRTTLCRHFVKNQGHCPLGEDCGFIHDLALAEHARHDVRYPNGRLPPKQSHCWAYVQGLCRLKDCQYLHPAAVEYFVPHTPCLSWPNCEKDVFCCFKHPEPLIPKATNFYPEPLPAIPAGTYQSQGTTYFPVRHEVNAPTSPSVIYSPSTRSGFSPYSNASLPFVSPVYEPVRPHLVAPPMVTIASNSSEDGNRYIGMPPPIPIHRDGIDGDLKADGLPTKDPIIPVEFPYISSTLQRSGHTRRFSVTLKSKEDSDALGLTHETRKSNRPSWMTHSKRDAETHRSWPWERDSSGVSSSAPSNKTEFDL